jgi:hypothetical protein
MHKVFDAQAKTGDVASGALVTKIGEQRASCLVWGCRTELTACHPGG